MYLFKPSAAMGTISEKATWLRLSCTLPQYNHISELPIMDIATFIVSHHYGYPQLHPFKISSAAIRTINGNATWLHLSCTLPRYNHTREIPVMRIATVILSHNLWLWLPTTKCIQTQTLEALKTRGHYLKLIWHWLSSDAVKYRCHVRNYLHLRH